MPHSEVFWLCTAFVAGTVAGSFLNVLVHRLPIMARGEDPELTLWFPRSRCPHCCQTIRLRHLVPILSYLSLRGRCAFCRASISLRYPVLELTAGLLAIGVVASTDSLLEAGVYAVLGWGLLALALIDWQAQLLPDLLVYPLLWLGLLVNTSGLFAPLHEAVIGAVAGYLSLWLLNHLFYFLRKEPGMGYGDFKMFAVCGAWLGWMMLPWIALAASTLTLLLWLVRRMWNHAERRLPFGPALALALFGFLIWRDSARSLIGGSGF